MKKMLLPLLLLLCACGRTGLDGTSSTFDQLPSCNDQQPAGTIGFLYFECPVSTAVTFSDEIVATQCSFQNSGLAVVDCVWTGTNVNTGAVKTVVCLDQCI